MEVMEIVKRLESQADPASREGMARVGIAAGPALGVKIPVLRKLAREIGRDHELARKLWAHELRETRILASMVADHRLVTEEQMESWAADFYDWEVCDQTCANLFEKTPWAHTKASAWCERQEEFVKRAGFVLMARLAVSDKKAGDEVFIPFFPLIVREAGDDRNFVKKAVNWALRQIGKRNKRLNHQAVKVAEKIKTMDSKSARWIASDALRELTGEAVQKRLKD